ncbi:efflux RND transporter periplasmic adaptor subunit [Stappia sp. GBMRC 2046]|uniref:Efflux RND transporter periplasmic adaptor subunit n=2 Tax=Stappia sediminis TaxID=2692190 RepID=A0A7X3S9T8_9HYPH|nr:efflux RND transporter periplasmic adaptor subunit [Stappia sediminis]
MAFEGVVEIAHAFDITPAADNKILRLNFIEGQLVDKGDLLVEFDPRFISLDADYAAAAENKAKAQLSLARDKLERLERLKENNTISVADYLTAVHDMQVAEADLELARITRRRAEILLEDQKLYAPFSGQMSSPKANEGADVEVGEDSAIGTIYRLDPINVRFDFPVAMLISRMQSGAIDREILKKLRIELQLPDGSIYEHTGRALSARPYINEATQMGTIIAQFPNPNYILRPGLRVTLRRAAE